MKEICPNLKNKEVAKEFGELKDIFGEEIAHLLWSRNNGYSIDKAPNGADSMLFGELLELADGNRTLALILKAKTYSDNFFKWFGDWTSDNKTSVSKVVDENGEPKVMFHGTDHGGFKKFDLKYFGKTDNGDNGRGFYFAYEKAVALSYGETVYPVYLSAKQPFYHTGFETSGIIKGFNRDYNPTQRELFLQRIKSIQRRIETSQDLLKENNDQFIAKLELKKIQRNKDELKRLLDEFEDKDEDFLNSRLYNTLDEYDSILESDPHYQAVVKDNSQIKSVFNNGLFANPDDIYASPQGELNMGAASRLSNIPRKGGMSTLQQYLKSHRDGVSSTALKLVMAAVNRYFNDNNTGITYEIADVLPGGEAAHYDRANKVIRINKNASFRNESKSLNPEVQTIVHEMLHAVTVDAIENNSRVRELFLHLLDATKKKLGNQALYYGLSDVYEFVAELSNAQFVLVLKSILLTRKQTLLDRIKGVIKKIYRQIFTSYKDFIGNDTVYSAAVEDLFAVMSNNIKKDKDVVDTNRKDVYKSITASVDRIDHIHSLITKLYQDMYNIYKKLVNKGVNRQKREDSLWATIKTLLAKEKKEASTLAINQALQQLGVYQLDPTIGVIPSRVDTILGFLQNKNTVNFDGVTADLIFDMKSNIIDFYNDLAKYLDDAKDDLDPQDKVNMDKLNVTIREINRLWRKAAMAVGDKIVDDGVEKYLNAKPSEIEEIRQVAKDWLHNNDMWGDEGWFTKFFNYSRNDSPIIRMAFQMILEADQETRRQSLVVQQQIAKAYKKATSLVDKASFGNWQTELMERDNDGNFTGLFRSAVNRGLFKKDLEKFKSDLCAEWEEKYGYHYTTDPITKETLRSDTGESIENERWINGVAPGYIQFLRRVEEWLYQHAHRRHNLVYYENMLSEPYDPATGRGHGLSPNTLSRQKYILDQLNYILQKCTDKKTGLVYPERLSPQDYQKLLMWRDALQDLGNPFDLFGNRKSDEELLMALELQAWNSWLLDQTAYNIDYDAYDEEYKNIVDAINRGEKTYTDLNRFIEANSEWSINPEFLEYIFGNNRSQKDYVTRMFLSSIKKLVKTKNGYVKDFSDIIFKQNDDGTVSVPDVWGYSRLADIKNNSYSNQTGVDPKVFRANIDMRLVDYTDPSGMCLAMDGVTKFDRQNNPSGLKAMSWFDYILNQYTDAAMDGRMPRFVSVDGSVGIDFATFGGDRNAIKQWISDNVLTYEKTWTGKGGIMQSSIEPLTIFSQMIPKAPTFGPQHKPTSRFVPRGRFSTKSSNSIFDSEFSEEEGSGIQPAFDIYGDREFVKMISKGGAKAEYYKLLLDTMEKQWEKLGVDPSYNKYKLPQIEATSAMKRSRMAKHPLGVAKNALENATGFTSDDLEARTDDDYVQRNGKWVLNTAPTRFINELKDPSMINSDLAYTVAMFVLMANNYVNKQKIQGTLETLGYNLDAENRDIEHLTTGKRQFERYQQELKLLLYELSETNENAGEKPGTALIMGAKAAKLARAGTGYLLLAYNLPSMGVGVSDAMVQLPAHAARGDLFGFKDLGMSMLKTFPALFKALLNIGNPIANCKEVAMMQKDGLVRTGNETFKNQYQNRIRKALNESATGGYTMGDYMVNMLAQRAMYSAKKYYPGISVRDSSGTVLIDIEEGFYTKSEFDKLMSNSLWSQKNINKEWANNHGESLWSAYYFENGVAKLKDKYKDAKVLDSKLSGAIQLTAALINGNSPKNDLSAVSNNILHKFFFLMRNYFIRRMEHWFAGYKPDNVARRFEEVTETRHRGSTTTDVKRRRKIPLTQEQKSRRQMYDYSTGEGNPAVVVNLLKGAVSQLAIFNLMMFHKQERLTDPRKINPNEAKALREFVTFGLTLALLSVGWMMFHRWVQADTDDLKPTTYEESLPSVENFINQHVALKMIDQIWFRVIDSQIQTFNPMAFIDMIKSATTVTSFVEKVSTPGAVILDLVGASGHDFDEIITSDSKYKYFPRWQRALWTATPLNNIQTWSSWRGNDKVGRWYFDNTITGTMFKGGGYNWKDGNEDEGESSRRPSTRRESSRRESSRRESSRRY